MSATTEKVRELLGTRLTELCGAVEETRPYGPGGCQVCFGCGKKDEEEMKRQFEAFAEGKPPPDPLPGRTKP